MITTQLNAQATGLAAPAHFAPRFAFSVTAGVRISALS
ncbi:hypothetical protein L687_02520 [Microbacterium maritypicum MF109]|uniref:Uncharacterized protein n=1 Tax=Microbacterium maritypicum MF109 TaxID=1333857 RepID=T5K3A9_MICMQ|nr:hypothetical protein L687_02520 [Microbacterium maritypicum MF109]